MVIRERRFSFNQVRQVLGSVLDHDLHAKRVDSLCDATLGVLRSSSLAVCTIGQGLAAARGLNPKHATKQSLPPRRRGSTACSPIQISRSTTSSPAGCPTSSARAAPS